MSGRRLIFASPAPDTCVVSGLESECARMYVGWVGLVGARWDYCWLGSGCRLGFSDAWVSNAVARRRLDASEAPRKDPLGVRKRECGLGARRPAVQLDSPFLTKLFRGCDWAALARFAFGRFL